MPQISQSEACDPRVSVSAQECRLRTMPVRAAPQRLVTAQGSAQLPMQEQPRPPWHDGKHLLAALPTEQAQEATLRMCVAQSMRKDHANAVHQPAGRVRLHSKMVAPTPEIPVHHPTCHL